MAQDRSTLELLQPRTEWVSITPTLSFLRDPSRNLSLERALEQDFTPVTGDVVDFGYSRDVIWLRFDISNQTEFDRFVLAMSENFLQLYEVWKIDAAGAATKIDAQDSSTVFSNRRIIYPELTTPFDLAPGADATIMIRYWSGGSSELAWTVQERAAFDQYGAQRTARNFIYYGMAMLLSGFAALAWLLTRRSVFGSYSFYAFAFLLFIMHADGNAFQYLWPNVPGFNAFASVPLGVIIIVGGLNFARSFLNTSVHNPHLDKVLLGMLVVTVLIGASTAFIDAQPIKRILILMSLLVTALLAISGLIAARTRFREVRFYVLAWMGAVVSSGLMTLRHWVGIELSEDAQYDAIRVILLFDALLMGLAVFDRFNWLKQSQQEALEVSLSQARKTVELNTRMQDLEHQVGIAEKLAASQERNIAQTAHDLRQPLTALRLNLRGLAGEDRDAATITEVEDTLGYLETLVAEQLSAALAAEKTAEAPPVKTEEASEIGPLLSSMSDMFSADAKAKGLRLTAIPSSASVPVPPLALMRMMSNLVSNAIRSTEAGGVVVGMRHAGGLRIEVHDTGPGLPRAVFEAAQSTETQVDSGTGGTGLGLSIVAELARKHGIRFERVEGVTGGTVLRLWMP